MDYKTNNYGPIILVVSILVVMVASWPPVQEARAEEDSAIVTVIFLVCLGPVILIAVLAYSIPSHPLLLLYAAIFSHSNVRKHMESIVEKGEGIDIPLRQGPPLDPEGNECDRGDPAVRAGLRERSIFSQPLATSLSAGSTT